MAGAGLIAIKRRIKSITNTQKITKAMGLVATSKLRKLRVLLLPNDRYKDEFSNIVEDIAENIKGYSPYKEGNKSKKKLYLAITSDTGLCGAYNSLVVAKTIDELKKDKENSELITIGQKGRAYFNKLKYNSLSEYVDIPNIPTINEAKVITNDILKRFNNEEVGEVYIVYAKFISTIKQEVTSLKILPIEGRKNNDKKNEMIFEPEEDEILDEIITSYLSARILNIMIHGKTSEEASRMTAMDGATKNASDLLEKLNLKYNRIRQSIITQEISEIVGGAEAQK